MLKCDICGGQLTMDASGEFAVCENCGMKHTKERMKIKAKEITDTLIPKEKNKVSDQVSNWETLATSAYDNSNYSEAYTYYCKVLEVNVKYWFATFRKGMCQGWQSNLGNIRVNEVLGGIKDAKKLLAEDETQTDLLKANGVVIMALELHNWIIAISNVVIEHANQYAGELVSAAREFYERERLIAELLTFNLNMFNEFVYEYDEDRIGTEKLIQAIMSTGRTTNANMLSKFRIKTGSNYSTFWEQFEDVYEDVVPDYQTNQARINLAALMTEVSNNLDIWKKNHEKREEEKAKKAKEEQIQRFWKSNPEIYAEYQRKLQLEENANDKRVEAQRKLNEAEAKLKPISSDYSQFQEKINIRLSDIKALERKIFGKKKAAEEAESLRMEIQSLKKQMEEIDPFRAEAQQLVIECKMNLSNCLEAYEIVHDSVGEILRQNGLV